MIAILSSILYFVLILYFGLISSQTLIYTGSLYYTRSQKLSGISLYYDVNYNNLRIDTSSSEALDMKIYTQNMTYYCRTSISNGHVSTECLNSSAMFSDYSPLRFYKSLPGKYDLSSEDSRVWALILTGSWYDEESIYFVKNDDETVILTSPYWEAYFTNTSYTDTPVASFLIC